MKSVLIIDDDETFCQVLCETLIRRGFDVVSAGSGAQALILAGTRTFEWAVLDLKIGHESGLSLIPRLLVLNASLRIVVLTGYAAIETAVEAIKLGASHYLAKPAGVQEIIAAFEKQNGDPALPVQLSSPSVADMEWDYIARTLIRNGGNISATARELRLHRRTLQRKMEKMPTRFLPRNLGK